MITRHSQPMFSIGRSIAPNLFSFKCYCHHKFADVVDLCLVVPYGTMEWWGSNTWCAHVCHIQITIYSNSMCLLKVLMVHEIFPHSVFSSLVKINWISLLPPSVCEDSCFILFFFFFKFFYCRNTHRDGGISTSEELTVDTSMVSLQANTYLGEYLCYSYCTS